MSARAASFLLPLFALSVSCEGLGRPLVDELTPGNRAELECTRRAPRCTDADAAPETLAAGSAAESSQRPCELGLMETERRIRASLFNCTLRLSAENGEERELVESDLRNVRVALDGSVHLRVVDSNLLRVSVEGERDVAEGSLTVSHSRLILSALNHDFVALISSVVDGVRVESSELSAVDLQARDSLLFGGALMVSGSRLRATRLGECDTIVMAETGLINASLDACSGVTRLYNVEGTGSRIDGELESDQSTFASSRFGVRERSQLHAWVSSVSNSVLCDGFEQMRLSASAAACIFCEGPMASPEADVCLDATGVSLENNACEVLVEPPTCEEFPRRPRPDSAF